MSTIKSFDKFAVNEDTTSNLVQQEQSLTQQINDLQKKLLQVQAQKVAAQQQTLAQNPQTQIPMSESLEDAMPTHIPKGSHIINAEYYPKSKEIYVHFTHEGKEHEYEADAPGFEDFLSDYIASTYDRDELQSYYQEDRDEDGKFIWFNQERFWEQTEPKEKVDIVTRFLTKQNAIH
jgi:hypothetical protein